MKLQNIRLMGRYRHRVTKQEVNIHKGQQVGRGTDVYFYLRQGKRVLIGASERFEYWVNVTK